MPRLLRTLLPLAAILTLSHPTSASAATGFTDVFDGLDAARWTVGDHGLGRSRLNPANVTVGAGALSLGLPAGTLDGAEVRTTALWRTGTTARG